MKLSREVRLGIFAVGALALFYFGITYLKGTKVLGSPYRLYTEYDDLQGLIKGNPIMINGLKVGQVGKLELNMGKGNVRALLEFDNALQIPSGSEAMIYSSDLLGSKAIEILYDSTQTTYLIDGDYLTGVIDTSFLDKASALVPEGTKIFIELGNLARELNGIASGLKQIINDPKGRSSINNTLDALEMSAQNVSSITSKMDSTTSVFNVIAKDSRDIISNVKEKNEDVTSIISNIKVTTDSLRDASGEIKQLMTDASSAVGSFENLVTKLDTTTSTMGMLFNDRQLYDSITATSANVNALLREVNENPQRFFDDLKIYLFERKPPKNKTEKVNSERE
ncbi:MAG: MlaD family protein [Bacteroidota bacterium]